jgi:hypothetical protein
VQYPWWAVVFCPYKNGVMPGEEGTLAAYYHKDWDKGHKLAEYPGYASASMYTVGILIGFRLYIVEVARLLKNETDSMVKLIPNLVCVKDWDRREKKGYEDIKSPIVIGEIAYERYYSWQLTQRDRQNANEKYRDVKFASSWSYSNRRDTPDVLENPIMAGTWIPSVIPAEEVWNNVTDYLLATKERPIADKRTDIEHLESAGFDKKTSFRNM